MRKLLILSALFANAAFGQGSSGVPILPVTTLPGSCGVTQIFLYQGTLYTCPSGTPVSGGGGGSGTVTTSGSPATNTFSMFTGATVIGNGPLSTDGTTLTSTKPIAAPSFIGTGTDPSINLPSNTTHSFSSGDLVNNAGALLFNTGTATAIVNISTAALAGTTAQVSTPPFTTTNTDTGSFVNGGSHYAPNMTSGQETFVQIGRDAGTNNTLSFNFHYSGSGSTSAVGNLGFAGNGNILDYYATGLVQIGKTLTVSTLPTCTTALKGARSQVSDATAPTFLGTLIGGGTVWTPVVCNGSAWLSQ